MYHPAPGGTGFLTHCCLHLWSRFWIRGCSWWFSVFSCCLLWNPQAHQEPCLMSFGSDGTHFMVGRGKDDRPWTKRGAHLSVGVCSLLPAVPLKLKAGPRGVQGPWAFWEQTSQKKCPGPLLLQWWVRGAGGGGHSWGESREDKLVPGNSRPRFQRSCYWYLLLWSERRLKRSDGSKGPRGERRIILRSLSTKIVAFRMTQTRFRVSQVTPAPTHTPHPTHSLTLFYYLSIYLSVCLSPYLPIKLWKNIVKPTLSDLEWGEIGQILKSLILASRLELNSLLCQQIFIKWLVHVSKHAHKDISLFSMISVETHTHL